MYKKTTRQQCSSCSSSSSRGAGNCNSNSQLLLITKLISCFAIIQHLSMQGNEEAFPSLLYNGTLLHDLFFCPTSTNNTSTTASAKYHVVLRILSTFCFFIARSLHDHFFGVPHLPIPVQCNNNNGKSKTPLP